MMNMNNDRSMSVRSIAKQIEELPPESRREVSYFVAFLRYNVVTAPPLVRRKKSFFADEPFVGVWKGRKDLTNSAGWVRRLRQKEWSGNRDYN